MEMFASKRFKKQIATLKEENQILNEQVKQLVKAERRLSLSQERLDRQLQRVEVLNKFSLAARRTEDSAQIFSLGIDALFSVFPYEQAVAFRIKEGAITPSVARAVQGRESRRGALMPQLDSSVRIRTIPLGAVIGTAMDVRRRLPQIAPLLDYLESQFADKDKSSDPSGMAVLVLPVFMKETTELQGALLLRRYATSFSFFEQLPSQEDMPFLRLVEAHVTQAFENARLYREAQQAIHVRDEFLSIASHELRTPITPLKNELHLIKLLVNEDLLTTYPKERLQKLVNIADRELVRLTRLIDGMLEVTRITSGRFILKYEKIRISELISEMVERFRYQIMESGGVVNLDLKDTEPGLWDRIRIEQVITNLITNAIRYGRGKPITVRSRTEHGYATITVEDEGIGIPKEQQTRLFRKFETAFSSRVFGGLGLGLYITRQIVEAHHGKIGVKSTPGVGTQFTMELPLDATSDIKTEKAAA
ncbi:MAG: hypothetical protein A2X94_13050 [Bdellovibrionales bacterium GWB1_55_8]|nr:MAG: hypothetical protein A2X94_13050 [Bdellovibrionales bacterium GWB1_55_8]